MRVLVVEDDLLVRELAVEALREEGYEVIHAANGEQALAWCKGQIVDVLITDIRLPGGVDGRQIAESCREHDPGATGDLRDGLFAGRGPGRCPAVSPCRSPTNPIASSKPSDKWEEKGGSPRTR